jgi:hypothetical protein
MDRELNGSGLGQTTYDVARQTAEEMKAREGYRFSDQQIESRNDEGAESGDARPLAPVEAVVNER